MPQMSLRGGTNVLYFGYGIIRGGVFMKFYAKLQRLFSVFLFVALLATCQAAVAAQNQENSCIDSSRFFDANSSLAWRAVNVRWLQVVNCNEWVSLREYPSVEAERLIAVPLGAWVRFLGYAPNEFTQVEYRGYYGYILSDYLE